MGPLSWLPKRYVLSVMVFWGFFTMYALRVNLNVAIGGMVHNHTVVENGETKLKEAAFNWDTKLQGIVLGSFYYGYMALQIPGGWLALRVGGTRLFGLAVLLASLLTMFTAEAARIDVMLLIAVRVAEGLVLGVMFPCNHAIWSKWAPEMERSTLISIAISGCSVGSIVTMPISGLLTKYGFDGGWPSVFYCFGMFGILWYFAWLFVVYESPSIHPTISEEEKTLIESGAVLSEEVSLGHVPWRSILTSGPVWGIIFAGFASDWGLYVLLICVPLFLLDVIHYEVHTMGFAAAAPFLFKAISCPLAGALADYLRRQGMRTKTVRRLFYSTGALVTGLFIVVAGYAHTPTLVLLCMCIAGTFAGSVYAGFHVNMLDIAPRNASVVMGVVNTVGSFAGFLSPMLVGLITHDKTPEEWHAVFLVTFFVYGTGTLAFCLLISADRQSWDKVEGLSCKPEMETVPPKLVTDES